MAFDSQNRISYSSSSASKYAKSFSNSQYQEVFDISSFSQYLEESSERPPLTQTEYSMLTPPISERGFSQEIKTTSTPVIRLLPASSTTKPAARILPKRVLFKYAETTSSSSVNHLNNFEASFSEIWERE